MAIKTTSTKFTKFKTVTRNGKKVILGFNPKTKKWEVQSKLVPLKKLPKQTRRQTNRGRRS